MAQTPINDRDIRFRDGLGLRLGATDASGDAVEHLRLSSELAVQESSIRERVGRLVNFRHVKYVRLRGVDRLKQGGKELVISYDAVEGDRLSTILETATKLPLTIEVDVALQIVRDLLPGIGILHDSRKVTHGAIGPERLAYTSQHRLIILDHGLGLALGRLNQPRRKLWEQYRIAVPGSARGVFDERTDVIQIGLVALAALLARPLTDEEYPAALKRLILSVREHSKHGTRPISPELRQWLERALPVDEEHAFRTVREAQEAFEALVTKGRYAPTAAAVKAFLTRYREATGAAAGVADAPAAPPVAIPREPQRSEVDRALEEFAITIGPKLPVSRSKMALPTEPEAPLVTPAAPAAAAPATGADVPAAVQAPTREATPVAPAEAARTLVVASAIEGHGTSARPEQAAAPKIGSGAAETPRARTRRSDRLSESPQARERVGDAARRARQSTLRSDIPRPASVQPDTAAQGPAADAPRRTRGRLDALRALEEELSRLAALDLVMPRHPVAADPPSAVLPEAPRSADAAVASDATMLLPAAVVAASEAPLAVVVEAAAVVDAMAAAPSVEAGAASAPVEAASLAPPAVETPAVARVERRPFRTDAIDAELAALMGERDADECATPIWTIADAETIGAADALESGPAADAAAASDAACAPVEFEVAAAVNTAAASAAASEVGAALATDPAVVDAPAAAVAFVESPPAVAAPEPAFELTLQTGTAPDALAESFELTPPAADPPAGIERPLLLDLSAFEQAADDIYAAAAQMRQSGRLFEVEAASETAVPGSEIAALAIAESAIVEPAVAESAIAESARAEIAIAEPAIAESVIVEAAIPEPAIAEFASAEVTIAEVAIVEPAIAESATVAAAIAEAAIAEPAIVEIAVAESAIAEFAIVEAAIAETAIAEPAFAETAIAEAAIAESAFVEAAIAEPVIAESAIAETAIAEPVIAESAIVEAAIAEPAIAESAIVEAAIAEPAIAESAIVEIAIAKTAIAEPAIAEIAIAEPVIAESATVEAAIARFAIAESVIVESAIVETAISGPASAEPAIADIAVAEIAVGELAVAETAATATAETAIAAAPRRPLSFRDRMRGLLGRVDAFRKPGAEAPAQAPMAAAPDEASPIETAVQPIVIEPVSVASAAIEAPHAEPAVAGLVVETSAVVPAALADASPADLLDLDVALPIDVAFESFDLVVAPEPLAVEAPMAAVEAEPAVAAPVVGPEPIAEAVAPAATPAAAAVADACAEPVSADASKSKRKRSRRRNKRRAGIVTHVEAPTSPAPAAPTLEGPAALPSIAAAALVSSLEPASPSASAGAEAPAAAPALGLTADTSHTAARASFYEFDAGPVADAVPAWARGTAGADAAAEAASDLQAVGAVEFQSGVANPEAAEAATRTTRHAPHEASAVHAPPAPHWATAQTLATPAANVVPFQPIAREAAATDVLSAPVASPRRSLLRRVDWRRTVAASLVLALLEGVAFAAAWWYVSPTEQGWLIVHTRPSGIEISVDGMSRGQTPYAVSLRPGRHTIELRQGTAARVIPVEIAAGVQTEQRVTWGKAFRTGQARITSSADGAHVTIDGKPQGRTPLTVSELSAGKHTVTVDAPTGSVTSSLIIEPGETTELDVPVYSGWISVLSPVELEILERGRFLGTTEADKIMLAPGKYNLVLKSEQYGYEVAQTVDVRPGATTAVSVLPTAEVKVDGPKGTELFVDGERVGALPIEKLKTPLGTREFTFRHPEQGERRQVVVVTLTAPVAITY